METLIEPEVLREVLAGHRGRCDGYKRASGLGHAREPFTWLSTSSLQEDNERLAGELQAFKLNRDAVWFEAWVLDDERWQLVFSGQVRVLFAEVDARLPKVRAILQWAPTVQASQPSSPYQSLAM